MVVLDGPGAVKGVPDPALRALVEQRFTDICAEEPYDYDTHGYMIVVEPGDSVAALEKESGCPITHSLFDNSRFGDPDFAPSFEWLGEHPFCYEMVFILADSGFGINFLIPKSPGVDAELLKLCKTYADPALTDTTP